MLYISYQGIFEGQDYPDANTPNQIGKAFNARYSCMVDVWRVDNQLYLGSYEPMIEVTEKYLQGNRFWINARNIDMQNWIVTQPVKNYPHYFWSNQPEPTSPVTVSSGQIWTPGTVATYPSTIIVLPEIQDRGMLSTIHLKCYGVCSTYLNFIKRIRNEGIWY